MFAIAYLPGTAVAISETFETQAKAEERMREISVPLAAMLHIIKIETDGDGQAVKGNR